MAVEGNRKIHFGWRGVGANFKERLSDWYHKFETRNVPHIAAGAAGGLASWIFGLTVWPGPHMALPFSLGFVFVVGGLWELKDFYLSDGFDLMDWLCDMVGALLIQGAHYSTHLWD